MASYCFEFDMRVGSYVSDTRSYASDAIARRAAALMLKARATEPGDQIYVWAGRKTSWGEAEGERLGTIAFYGHLGGDTVFIPDGAA